MEKKFYVAPAIEIEQIAIEKGFAASGDHEAPGVWPNELKMKSLNNCLI